MRQIALFVDESKAKKTEKLID
eukprot:SAG11_NODE_23917_length_381_cov_0.737589_1_plen_21_part_10